MFCYIFNFNNLINPDFVYWFCALAGSGMFLIQLLLMLFGISDPEGFNASEGSFSDHSHDVGRDSLDARKFKWFSVQAITGFLMMFGWTAITCKNEFGFQNIATIGISIAAGIGTALMIRSIFKLAKRLQSPGSAYRIEDAIGKEAYVYQRIPKGGIGKISISLHHLTYEIDAISHNHEELPSFIRVKIIEKKDDSTVVVIPL